MSGKIWRVSDGSIGHRRLSGRRMTRRFGTFLAAFAVLFLFGVFFPRCMCFGPVGSYGTSCCSIQAAVSESQDNCCQSGCCAGQSRQSSNSQQKTCRCGPFCPCAKPIPDPWQVVAPSVKESLIYVGTLPEAEPIREIPNRRFVASVNGYPTPSLARLCRWLK